MLYYRESSSHPFGQGSQLESRVSTEVSAAVVSQALWTVTGLLCLCRNVYYVSWPVKKCSLVLLIPTLIRTTTKLHLAL